MDSHSSVPYIKLGTRIINFLDSGQRNNVTQMPQISEYGITYLTWMKKHLIDNGAFVAIKNGEWQSLAAA